MKQRVESHCISCGKRIPSGLRKCLACSLNLKSGEIEGTCRCLVCGASLQSEDDTCSRCGTDFQENAEGEAGIGEEEAEEYFCMICGHSVSKTASSCRVCGTVFVEDAEKYSGPIVEKVERAGRSSGARPSPG